MSSGSEEIEAKSILNSLFDASNSGSVDRIFRAIGQFCSCIRFFSQSLEYNEEKGIVIDDIKYMNIETMLRIVERYLLSVFENGSSLKEKKEVERVLLYALDFSLDAMSHICRMGRTLEGLHFRLLSILSWLLLPVNPIKSNEFKNIFDETGPTEEEIASLARFLILDSKRTPSILHRVRLSAHNIRIPELESEEQDEMSTAEGITREPEGHEEEGMEDSSDLVPDIFSNIEDLFTEKMVNTIYSHFCTGCKGFELLLRTSCNILDDLFSQILHGEDAAKCQSQKKEEGQERDKVTDLITRHEIVGFSFDEFSHHIDFVFAIANSGYVEDYGDFTLEATKEVMCGLAEKIVTCFKYCSSPDEPKRGKEYILRESSVEAMLKKVFVMAKTHIMKTAVLITSVSKYIEIWGASTPEYASDICEYLFEQFVREIEDEDNIEMITDQIGGGNIKLVYWLLSCTLTFSVVESEESDLFGDLFSPPSLSGAHRFVSSFFYKLTFGKNVETNEDEERQYMSLIGELLLKMLLSEEPHTDLLDSISGLPFDENLIFSALEASFSKPTGCQNVTAYFVSAVIRHCGGHFSGVSRILFLVLKKWRDVLLSEKGDEKEVSSDNIFVVLIALSFHRTISIEDKERALLLMMEFIRDLSKFWTQKGLSGEKPESLQLLSQFTYSFKYLLGLDLEEADEIPQELFNFLTAYSSGEECADPLPGRLLLLVNEWEKYYGFLVLREDKKTSLDTVTLLESLGNLHKLLIESRLVTPVGSLVKDVMLIGVSFYSYSDISSDNVRSAFPACYRSYEVLREIISNESGDELLLRLLNKVESFVSGTGELEKSEKLNLDSILLSLLWTSSDFRELNSDSLQKCIESSLTILITLYRIFSSEISSILGIRGLNKEDISSVLRLSELGVPLHVAAHSCEMFVDIPTTEAVLCEIMPYKTTQSEMMIYESLRSYSFEEKLQSVLERTFSAPDSSNCASGLMKCIYLILNSLFDVFKRFSLNPETREALSEECTETLLYLYKQDIFAFARKETLKLLQEVSVQDTAANQQVDANVLLEIKKLQRPRASKIISWLASYLVGIPQEERIGFASRQVGEDSTNFLVFAIQMLCENYVSELHRWILLLINSLASESTKSGSGWLESLAGLDQRYFDRILDASVFSKDDGDFFFFFDFINVIVTYGTVEAIQRVIDAVFSVFLPSMRERRVWEGGIARYATPFVIAAQSEEVFSTLHESCSSFVIARFLEKTTEDLRNEEPDPVFSLVIQILAGILVLLEETSEPEESEISKEPFGENESVKPAVLEPEDLEMSLENFDPDEGGDQGEEFDPEDETGMLKMLEDEPNMREQLDWLLEMDDQVVPFNGDVVDGGFARLLSNLGLLRIKKRSGRNGAAGLLEGDRRGKRKKKERQSTSLKRKLEESKLCTYSITKSNYQEQHWYHCYTCGLIDNTGCCAPCIMKCHRGHDVSYAKSGRFYCDCGAGGSCKCLVSDKDEGIHRDGGRDSPIVDYRSDEWVKTTRSALRRARKGKSGVESEIIAIAKEKRKEFVMEKGNSIFSEEFSKGIWSRTHNLMEGIVSCIIDVSRGLKDEIRVVMKKDENDISLYKRRTEIGKILKSRMKSSKSRLLSDETRQLFVQDNFQYNPIALRLYGSSLLAVGVETRMIVFSVDQILVNSTSSGNEGNLESLSEIDVSYPICSLNFNRNCPFHLLVGGQDRMSVLQVAKSGETKLLFSFSPVFSSINGGSGNPASISGCEWVPNSRTSIWYHNDKEFGILDISRSLSVPVYLASISNEDTISSVTISKYSGSNCLIVGIGNSNCIYHSRSKIEEGEKVVTVRGKFSPIGGKELSKEEAKDSDSDQNRNLCPQITEIGMNLYAAALSTGELFVIQTIRNSTGLSLEMKSRLKIEHPEATLPKSMRLLESGSMGRDCANFVVLLEERAILVSLVEDEKIYDAQVIKTGRIDCCVLADSASDFKRKMVVLSGENLGAVEIPTGGREERGIRMVLPKSISKSESLRFFERQERITPKSSFSSPSTTSNIAHELLNKRLSSLAGVHKGSASEERPFSLDVTCNIDSYVITGLRVHLGKTGLNMPKKIGIFERYVPIMSFGGWTDIPLAVVESLLVEKVLLLKFYPQSGISEVEIDAIEVYGRSKDEFGYAEKKRQLITLLNSHESKGTLYDSVRWKRENNKIIPVLQDMLLLASVYSRNVSSEVKSEENSNMRNALSDSVGQFLAVKPLRKLSKEIIASFETSERRTLERVAVCDVSIAYDLLTSWNSSEISEETTIFICELLYGVISRILALIQQKGVDFWKVPRVRELLGSVVENIELLRPFRNVYSEWAMVVKEKFFFMISAALILNVQAMTSGKQDQSESKSRLAVLHEAVESLSPIISLIRMADNTQYSELIRHSSAKNCNEALSYILDEVIRPGFGEFFGDQDAAYGCNRCGKRIEGTAYHCEVCEDYDLCEECYSHREEAVERDGHSNKEHSMYKFRLFGYEELIVSILPESFLEYDDEMISAAALSLTETETESVKGDRVIHIPGDVSLEKGLNAPVILLESLLLKFDEIARRGGLAVLPTMQILFNILSHEITPFGAIQTKLYDMVVEAFFKVVETSFDGIEMGSPIKRTKGMEVSMLALLFFRLLLKQVIVNRSKNKSEEEGYWSSANTNAEMLTTMLNKHNIHQLLRRIAVALIHDLEIRTEQEATQPRLLSVMDSRTEVQSYLPFLKDDYVSMHKEDLFSEWKKTIVDSIFKIVMRMATLLDPSGERGLFFDNWIEILKPQLVSTHLIFLRAPAKSLLNAICGNNKEKAHLIRDSLKYTHILLKTRSSLKAQKEGVSSYFKYEEKVKLLDNLNAVYRVAEKRTEAWATYCSSHEEEFRVLLDVINSAAVEVVGTAIKLVSLTISHGLQQAEEEKGKPPLQFLMLSREAELDSFFERLLFAELDEVRESVRSLIMALWTFSTKIEDGYKVKATLVSMLLHYLKRSQVIDGAHFEELLNIVLDIARLSLETEKANELALDRFKPSLELMCRSLAEVAKEAVDLLRGHENSLLYSSLGEYLVVEDFYFETGSCNVCNSEKVEMNVLNISNSSIEKKFTDSSVFLKLPAKYFLHSVNISLSGIFIQRMIKRIELYYNNKEVMDVVDLNNSSVKWKKAKAVDVGMSQHNIEVPLIIPIECYNLHLVVTSFYENEAVEDLRCPRCCNVVTDKHGLCSNCQENAYQCRDCRNINYENLAAFFCNECGTSKYCTYSIDVHVKESYKVETLEDDDDRKASVVLIEKESENVYSSCSEIRDIKYKISKLVGGFSEVSPLAKKAKPLLSVAGLTEEIGQLAMLYYKDCKSSHIAMRNSMKKIQTSRMALVGYLESHGGASVMALPSSPKFGSRTRIGRPGRRCFKCSLSIFNRCVPALLELARISSCKEIFNESDILELFLGLHYGGDVSYISANEVRPVEVGNEGNKLCEEDSSQEVNSGEVVTSFICALVQNNKEANRKVLKAIEMRIDALLANIQLAKHKAWKNALVLLTKLIYMEDTARNWEMRLRFLFRVLREALEIRSKSALIDEHIILPSLFVLTRLLSPNANQPGEEKTEEDIPNLFIDLKKWLDGESILDRDQELKEVSFKGEGDSKGQTAVEMKTNLLARKYLDIWMKRCQVATGRLVLRDLRELGDDSGKSLWLIQLLLCRSSAPMREQASLLIRQLFAEGEERLLLADMLLGLLGEVVEYGDEGDFFDEYFELFRGILQIEEVKKYLVVKNFLEVTTKIVKGEIKRINSSFETQNIFNGYTLLNVVHLINAVVDVQQIAVKLRLSPLLDDLFYGFLLLGGMVVQHNKWLEESKSLLGMLISTVRHEEKDSSKEGTVKSYSGALRHFMKDETSRQSRIVITILEELCEVLCPKEAGKEFFMDLVKISSQEEFIRGNMHNPFGSLKVGPLMRDVKNKICRDLDLMGLLADDNGLELLVDNQIIKLDCSVEDVYKHIWLKSASGLESENMIVIYRLQGLDGEATEPIVEREKLLATSKGEKGDIFLEMELKNEDTKYLRESGGLENVISLAKDLSDFESEKEKSLLIFSLINSTSKVGENREVLLENGIIPLFQLLLLKLLEYISSVEASDSSIVEIFVTNIETLRICFFEKLKKEIEEVAGASEEEQGQFTSLIEFLIDIDGRRKRWERKIPGYDIYEELMAVASLWIINSRSARKALSDFYFESGFLKSTLNENVANIVNALSLPRYKTLEGIFATLWALETLSFSGNLPGTTGSFPSGDGLKMNKDIHCTYITRMQDDFLGYSVVEVVSSYLEGLRGQFDVENQQGSLPKEKRDLLNNTSIALALRAMTVLSFSHKNTQRDFHKRDLLRLVFLFENVSVESNVGSLSENLIQALSENSEEISKSISDIRKKRKEYNKRLAIEKREKMLKKMGLLIKEDGSQKIELQSTKMTVMLEELEEEELVCMICREGCKYNPEMLLGTYVCSSLQHITSIVDGKIEKEKGVQTTSSFNIIHIDCHEKAARAESRVRDVWEGATMRNGKSFCNNLFPLKCPSNFHVYREYVSTYWDVYGGLGRTPSARFRLIVHDVKALLGRLALFKDFELDVETGGGSESNIQMAFFMIQMGAYLLLHVSGPEATESTRAMIDSAIPPNGNDSQISRTSIDYLNFISTCTLFVWELEEFERKKILLLKSLVVGLANSISRAGAVINKEDLFGIVQKEFLFFSLLRRFQQIFKQTHGEEEQEKVPGNVAEMIWGIQNERYPDYLARLRDLLGSLTKVTLKFTSLKEFEEDFGISPEDLGEFSSLDEMVLSILLNTE